MTTSAITLRIRVRWKLLFVLLWSIGARDLAFRACVTVRAA